MFLSEISHGQRSLAATVRGVAKSWTWLSNKTRTKSTNLHSQQQEGFLFSTPSPAFVIYGPFNDGQSDQGTFLVAQLAKNLPVIRETPVRFLGRDDALEKG